jgi:hypothetical protein
MPYDPAVGTRTHVHIYAHTLHGVIENDPSLLIALVRAVTPGQGEALADEKTLDKLEIRRNGKPPSLKKEMASIFVIRRTFT